MNNYPEHDKLHEIKDQSQWLGGFIEYLRSEGYTIAKYDDHDRLYPVNKGINSWLSQYFNIDLVKLNEEKLQMLEELRQLNNK